MPIHLPPPQAQILTQRGEIEIDSFWASRIARQQIQREEDQRIFDALDAIAATDPRAVQRQVQDSIDREIVADFIEAANLIAARPPPPVYRSRFERILVD